PPLHDRPHKQARRIGRDRRLHALERPEPRQAPEQRRQPLHPGPAEAERERDATAPPRQQAQARLISAEEPGDERYAGGGDHPNTSGFSSSQRTFALTASEIVCFGSHPSARSFSLLR